VEYQLQRLLEGFNKQQRVLLLDNYQQLSKFYDKDWGSWPLQYLHLLKTTLETKCPGHANILDLACGTGILASEMSKWGHNVTGVDLSSEMIARAQEKLIPNASFVLADMCTFEAETNFDLVTCTFDAFNYCLNEESIVSLFRVAASALKKSGIFLFDSNTHYLFLHHHNGILYRNVNGVHFTQSRIYDISTHIATTIFEFPDGTSETHAQHAWDLERVRPMLEKTGFQILESYADFSMTVYLPYSERLICLAQKRIEDEKAEELN
jgi:SAM-dependent methyltransferase